MTNKKSGRINVSPRQASLARRMRLAMTEPERKLWKALRWRLPLEGTHFRRQVPIGPYIADFCSHGARLIIEVDGEQHADEVAIARDTARTLYLNSLGYRVLRFSNRDVMISIDIVLDTIAAEVEMTPTPIPSPQGGGE